MLLVRITYLLLLFFQNFGIATNETFSDPVQWTTSTQQLDQGVYRLHLSAEIAKDWYVFSQYSPEGGSQPAYFEFSSNEDIERLGPVVESTFELYPNEVFGVTEKIFRNRADFYQDVRLKSTGTSVEITLYYQVCKTVCIAASKTFVYDIGVLNRQNDTSLNNKTVRAVNELRLPLKNTNRIAESISKSSSSQTHYPWLLGLLGGFIALLTPCVFPLIPLTTSYFSSQKGRGLPVFYGIAIVLIYSILGVPFIIGWAGDPQFFNEAASTIWVNTLLFVVLVGFSFSFLSGRELQLPQSWLQRVDQKANQSKGLIAVVFMALTLVLVSFSCTGPILGTALGSLLASSSESVGFDILIVFNGFGFGLAVPFTLFAVFPSVITRLPRSGVWMKDLKVALGVLELFLAFKFLSNADLIGKWNLLKYQLILGIWISLLFGLLFYLIIQWYKTRKAFGFKLFLFSLSSYLIFLVLSGFESPSGLKSLSAFSPPSYYRLAAKSDSHCPLGLDCTTILSEGIKRSKVSRKPILIDFTGYSCVNCRKMESTVWTDPEIHRLLATRFELISLYVDDRSPADPNMIGTYRLANGALKEIKTKGQYYSLLQGINFGMISQPYYVILSPELELLASPIQMASKKEFKTFLLQALQEYDELESN